MYRIYTIGDSAMPVLKRTQMYLPEATLADLKRKAEREKTTVSEIVRLAISEHLTKETAKNWSEDPLWDIIGAVDSKVGDLAGHHDKYLYGKTE
jgi:hypothetical protein